jgi:hypothetical protein
VTAQLTLTTDIEAVHFLAANPGAEAFILGVALEDMRNRVQPSMDYCGHRLRRSGLLKPGVGHEFTFNDHKTSVLGRYFKREYGIPFHTRASKHDGVGAL